jgi:hypothetical protein
MAVWRKDAVTRILFLIHKSLIKKTFHVSVGLVFLTCIQSSFSSAVLKNRGNVSTTAL